MSDKNYNVDPKLESINTDISNQYVFIESAKRKQRNLETAFILVLILSLAITFLPYGFYILILQAGVLLKLYNDIIKAREAVVIEKSILTINEDLRHMFYDESFRPNYLKQTTNLAHSGSTVSNNTKSSN
jgi:hypothetical protein